MRSSTRSLVSLGKEASIPSLQLPSTLSWLSWHAVYHRMIHTVFAARRIEMRRIRLLPSKVHHLDLDCWVAKVRMVMMVTLRMVSLKNQTGCPRSLSLRSMKKMRLSRKSSGIIFLLQEERISQRHFAKWIWRESVDGSITKSDRYIAILIHLTTVGQVLKLKYNNESIE